MINNKICLLLLVSSITDPNIIAKYKMGYNECAQDCIRFMSGTHNSSQLLNNTTNSPTDDARQRMLNLMRQIPQQQQQLDISMPIDYHHNSRQLSVSPISSDSSSSCSLSCSTSPCSKQTVQNATATTIDNCNLTSPKLQDDDLNNSNSSNSNVWRPW
jgi:hypothetical protein